MNRRPFILVCLIAVLAFAGWMYKDTLHYDFTWDDKELLFDYIEATTPSHWVNAFTHHVDRLYRPLRTITFALEYSIGGGRPETYHAGNLILYIAVCAAFFFMVSALCKEKQIVALGATLLFAVHPLHAEVVASISNGRADLLAALFLFSSMAVLANNSRALNTAGALLLFCFALLSKESTVVACGVVFIMMLIRDKESEWKPRFIRALGISFLFCVPAVLLFLVRGAIIHGLGQTTGYHGGSFSATMIASLSVIPDYAAALFSRTLQCPSYTVPIIQGFHAKAAAGVFMLCAGVVIGLLTIRRASLISLSIFWILFLWLPVSNLAPIASLKADRFMFLSSAGACLALSLIIDAAAMRFPMLHSDMRPSLFLCTLCAMAVYFALGVGPASEPWRNEHNLWSRAVVCDTASPLAWNNYGRVLFYENKSGEAEAAFRKSIALNPRFKHPHANLADILARRGDYHGAVRELMTCYELAPDDSEIHYRLFVAHRKLDRNREARHWYELWRKSMNSAASP